MTTFPLDYDSIVTRLNEIDTAISTYYTDPTKFIKMNAGSINVDVPALVQNLKEEREYYWERLKGLPWTVESDLEGTL